MVYCRSLISLIVTAIILVPSADAFSTNLRPVFETTRSRHPPAISLQSKEPTPAIRSSPTSLLALAQYSGQAISLFNNMKVPASIIAGALVPLGFLAPISLQTEADDSKWEQRMRKFYYVLSALTLATELIAVMWATVATNGLTERVIAPAESVWHLLKRECELEWAAVNTHFVVGMLGFLGMIASRAYFMAGKGLLGKSVMGIGLSGLALMVSIVNRGVASGGGSCEGATMRYGSNILALAKSHITMLLRRAFSRQTFGPIEILSVALFVVSVLGAVKAVFQDPAEQTVTLN